MRKSILFIIDSLTCGGAEKSLVSLLPLLNQEKYELYLWTRSPGGAFASLVPKTCTYCKSTGIHHIRSP